MHFKSYWRSTVLCALFLHFFVWLGLALVLPHLDFSNQAIAADEMEVVDLPEDGSDGPPEEQPKPEPPKLEPPKPVEEPPAAPVPQEEILPTESSPTEAAEMEEAVAELAAAEKKGDTQGAERPPAPQNQYIGALVVAGQTPNTNGTDFRGTIGILVYINAEGSITGYRFTQTSGRRLVDQLVLNALKSFKFDPAVDFDGKPMKTMRLLKFHFDGSSGHLYDDDENKRIRAAKQLAAAEKSAAGRNAPPNP